MMDNNKQKCLLLPERVLLSTVDPERLPTVNTAIFSSDGSLILTAVGDDYNGGWSLWLWEASTGIPVTLIIDDDPLTWKDVRQALAIDDLLILESLPSLPIQAVFSDDGLSIACAHKNGISVWDLAHLDAHMSCAERWHSAKPETISYHFISQADLLQGSRILTSALQVHLDRLIDPTMSVIQLCWRPASDELLLITRDGVAQLWNPFTKQMLRLFHKDDAILICAAFDPTGNKLVTTATNHTLQIWDVATARLIREYALPDMANSVTWSSTGTHILTIHPNHRPRLWDLAQDCWFILQSDDQLIGCFSSAFSSDGSAVALISNNNTVELWRISPPHQIITLMINGERFESEHNLQIQDAGWFAQLLDWRHDDQKLLVSGTNALTWLWDVSALI